MLLLSPSLPANVVLAQPIIQILHGGKLVAWWGENQQIGFELAQLLSALISMFLDKKIVTKQ